MPAMGRSRTIKALFRTLLAVVFGTMSLFHGPVMAFAKAAPHASHHQQMLAGHGADHHMVGHDGAGDHQPPAPKSETICYSVGCFVSLQSHDIRTPVISLIALERLTPARARTLAPAQLDPAVPPPRLQV